MHPGRVKQPQQRGSDQAESDHAQKSDHAHASDHAHGHGHLHAHEHAHSPTHDVASPESIGWAPALRARGLRVTPARVAVLDALRSAGHSSPEDVHGVVNASAVNLSTVYRTLESLAEAGMVTHTHLAGHQASWSLASTAHHAHLVCRVCESVTELDDEATAALREAALVNQGFVVEVSHLSVFGVCRDCAAKA